MLCYRNLSTIVFLKKMIQSRITQLPAFQHTEKVGRDFQNRGNESAMSYRSSPSVSDEGSVPAASWRLWRSKY